MIPKAINDFRRDNGVGPVEIWNKKISEHCLLHTAAMVHRGVLYHAPQYYREDFQEIVGSQGFLDTFENTIRSLIFKQFGNSPEHRQTLLTCDEMGYGDLEVKTPVGRDLVITIRGR